MKEDELDTLLMVFEGILVNFYFKINKFRAIKKINMIIISWDFPMTQKDKSKNTLKNIKSGNNNVIS